MTLDLTARHFDDAGAQAGRERDGAREDARALLAGVGEALMGKPEACAQVLCALLAGGHVLLEDRPGVGKTTLATAFSKLLGLTCKRVQMTPDVMPSDIVGFSVWEPASDGRPGRLAYQQGAVFCNLLLADELNRTSPKTQSALLEAMAERSVTVDGQTRPLPDPFFVIATENPLGSAGTQPLPLSQLDRFCCSLSLGYPTLEAELAMARDARGGRRTDGLAQVVDARGLARMREAAQATYVHDDVLAYAVALVRASRETPLLACGASPRATLDLVRLARAAAWLGGEDFVSPAHVDAQFACALRHRVALSPEARAEGWSADEVLAQVASGVERPRPTRGL